jgi:Tol biopolymer transport system component/DNA-binding winged helix-turn-helix (wHTH) protein
MNDAIAAIALGRRIDLTREADFVAGGVEVRPTACEVIAGGARIKLQPRVMQVLVALSRAAGEPVSREALTSVCWSQVAVSDDALNRCIQRLRRLAENEVKGAFIIETIPRLGYRLAVVQPPAEQARAPDVQAVKRRGLVPAIAICVVGMAALVAAGVWLWSTRPARWSIERSEVLVSTPLLESQPALSPDGTMAAYVAGPDAGNTHIYLKRLSSVESIQLTDDGYADQSPAWSPDGARIAYIGSRKHEPCRIFVVAVPAGLPREVGRCQFWDTTGLAWTPSGDALLIADSTGPPAPRRIVRVDLASGRRVAITHPPGGVDDLQPSVSPNGRWLLFARISHLPQQVTIHDLRTGEERILARLAQEYLGQAWADDSKSVFVVSEKAQGTGIWSFPIDGGPRDTLIGIGSPVELQDISTARNGLLAAADVSGRTDLVRPPGPKDASPIVVDPANRETWSPAYAPDGTLAMASTRAGDAGIWLMPPGGKARVLLSFKDLVPFGLSWSPDGADLAFIALGADVDVLHVITAAGEVMARITIPGTASGVPAWTADGRAILLPVRDRGGWRIWRADLARPAAPYPITGYGWAGVNVVGAALYAAGRGSGRSGVWRLDPKPVKIIDLSPDFAGSWTVFRDRIVFPDGADPRQHRLLSVPLSGGASRPFAGVPGIEDDWDFAIDPRSGVPVYASAIDADLNIELFHLARR